jgi:uncharacterized membrane protein
MTTPLTLRLRMIIGVLALIGLLVAVYLALYENGLSQSMVCPDEGCDKVNTSEYVVLFTVQIAGATLSIKVADLGVIGYTIILIITLGWITRREMFRIPVGVILLALSGFGFLFSVYLTYLELFRIHAICTWCVSSAVLMTAIFALAVAAWPAERSRARAQKRH